MKEFAPSSSPFKQISTEMLERMWDEADNKGQSRGGYSAGQISEELGRRNNPGEERRYEVWRALNQQGSTPAEVIGFAREARKRIMYGTPDGLGEEKVFYIDGVRLAEVNVKLADLDGFIGSIRNKSKGRKKVK